VLREQIPQPLALRPSAVVHRSSRTFPALRHRSCPVPNAPDATRAARTYASSASEAVMPRLRSP
jgi:hypothetical protein